MPGLINRVPKKPDMAEFDHKVNIVRIKHLKRPVEKIKKEPLKKPKKIKVKKNQVYTNPVKKLNIPFELNPKLSPSIATVPVPSVVPLDIPKIKPAYDIYELDNPLTPLVMTQPIYPMRAKQRGIEGWVKVQFIINEEGNTESIQIIKAEPETIFNKNVIRCVLSWRFSPGTIDGIKVKTLADMLIKFELDQ